MAHRKKTKKGAAPPGARQQELPLSNQRDPTLREVVRWYTDTWPGDNAPRTRDGKRAIFNQALGELPDYPTGSDLVRWLGGRVDAGTMVRGSANRYRGLMVHLYRCAGELEFRGLLNPFARVPRWKEPEEKPRCLPDPERTFARFLEVCRNDLERAFLCVLRYLGLRRGEALGLEPRHLSVADLGAATLRVEQQRQPDHATPHRLKTDTSAATLEVPPELAGLLRRVLAHRLRHLDKARGEAQRLYLFPFNRDELEDLLARLRAAVPGALPKRQQGRNGGGAWHPFRHTFADELAKAGVKLERIQVLLRHKNPATTHKYIGALRGREQPREEIRAYWKAHPPVVDAARTDAEPVFGSERKAKTGSRTTTKAARAARSTR